MESAKAISGSPPLNSGVTRRLEGSTTPRGSVPVSNEPPPSGVAKVGGQSQTVGSLTNTEKSMAFGENAHPDKAKLVDAVKNMNDFLQMVRRTLQFSVDEDSGRMVVQIKDAETNEVIRQIPSENMIKLAEQMDKFKGFLFEDKV